MKIITTHINPDYDALASAIAAKKIYPDATIVLPGTQEKSMKNFFIQTIIYSLDVKKINDVDLESIDTLILVDTSKAERIGAFSKIVHKKNIKVIIYDHHLEENDIDTEQKIIKNTGACTSILVDLLKKLKIKITPEEATVLMMGIYEDTGNLTFNTTTPNDYYAAAHLLESGASLDTVRDILYHDITIEQLNILKQFMETEEQLNIKGIDISIVTATYDEYIPELAVAVHKYKSMKNIKVLFAILRLENKIYLICRSSSPQINVQKIAEYFNGGGHNSAASAVIKDKTLTEVSNELKAFLYTLEGLNYKAKDIMTYPVKTVYEDNKISYADRILNRYNINALPVLERNSRKLKGIISRQIIGKAQYHNLENILVKEFMQTEFNTVSPDADFQTIKDLILRENQRLLPVIYKDKLVGVITRTDILKTLYNIEEELLKHEKKIKQQKDITNLMRNEIPPIIYEKLIFLGEIAYKLNFKLYIVGGFVRDLILRKKNFDIDLVIEGDGIIFSKEVQKYSKNIKKIRTFSKFKTAKLFFKDGLIFDIATARLEYYEKPGSLPIVERSSLKMDLYRRDFTINALAIEITKDKFGELIDFFGGLNDIRDKKIRIIHNLSFVEDPTRIFRAFRFAVRFNFEIGEQTRSLIKNAKSLKLLDTISGRRIFNELKLIFEEEKPVEILIQLNEFKLIQFISTAIKLNEDKISLLKSIENIIKWYEITFSNEKPILKWILFLRGLMEKTKVSINSVGKKLKLSEKENKLLLTCNNEILHILKYLNINSKISDYDVYKLLLNKMVESILFSICKIENKKLKDKLIKFLIEYRYLKPDITGKDLIKLGFKPSPMFKKIFDKIIEEKIQGKLKNIEEEKLFILNNFQKKEEIK